MSILDEIVKDISDGNHSKPIDKFATDDQDIILSLPGVMSGMTGVSYIRQNCEGYTTLHYVDGDTESAYLTYNLASADDVFKIVGDIQSMRK